MCVRVIFNINYTVLVHYSTWPGPARLPFPELAGRLKGNGKKKVKNRKKIIYFSFDGERVQGEKTMVTDQLQGV
jgi:hypothetical protein